MEFRNFLENAGYFDDKQDTRPQGLGRQQDMPGTTLVTSTSSIKGKIVKVDTQPTQVKISIAEDDADIDQEDQKVTTVAIPIRRYLREREQAPRKGDVIQVELDDENNLVSYDILHRI